MTLGGVPVEVDGLDNSLLICPYKDEGENVEVKCDTNLASGEKREPGGGEMPDVTRLPDGELEAMFFDPETYPLCQDIFASGEFYAAMMQIPPLPEERIRKRWSYAPERLDRIQQSMATVFDAINWNYCHRIRRIPRGTVHAEFQRDRSIVIYDTACRASKLYGHNIRYLNAGHRFYLIAGHELGHAINAFVGDSGAISGVVDEEQSATVYGTFLAECFSRTFQRLVSENDYPDETPMMKEARECLVKKWKRLELSLADLRKNPVATKSDATLALEGAMACIEFDE